MVAPIGRTKAERPIASPDVAVADPDGVVARDAGWIVRSMAIHIPEQTATPNAEAPAACGTGAKRRNGDKRLGSRVATVIGSLIRNLSVQRSVHDYSSANRERCRGTETSQLWIISTTYDPIAGILADVS